MSFLLDALRKSENQKHRGNVPTIHSSSSLETRKTSPLKPGLVALILLPAILVIAWYAWQSSRQARELGEAVVQRPVEARPAFVEEPEVARSAAEPVRGLPENVPEMDSSAASRPGHSTDDESGIARTPVEMFEALAEPVVNAPADDTSSPVQGTDPQVVQQAPARRSGAPVSAVSVEDPSDAQPRPRDFREPSLDAISYWRLPQNVREEIGQLKISVLVYADEPDSRFIIMNGRRLVQGDEPLSGLVLREISREGAIFSFRLYRFLVPR